MEANCVRAGEFRFWGAHAPRVQHFGALAECKTSPREIRQREIVSGEGAGNSTRARRPEVSPYTRERRRPKLRVYFTGRRFRLDRCNAGAAFHFHDLVAC